MSWVGMRTSSTIAAATTDATATGATTAAVAVVVS